MSTAICHSALYSGWVHHRRFAPRVHAFRYRMGLLYLDLDEQPALFALSRLAGNGRWQPFAFRESDYLPEYTRQGMRLISVVLGSKSMRAREDASAALLNYGYTFFETVKVHDKGKASRAGAGSAGHGGTGRSA